MSLGISWYKSIENNIRSVLSKTSFSIQHIGNPFNLSCNIVDLKYLKELMQRTALWLNYLIFSFAFFLFSAPDKCFLGNMLRPKRWKVNNRLELIDHKFRILIVDVVRYTCMRQFQESVEMPRRPLAMIDHFAGLQDCNEPPTGDGPTAERGRPRAMTWRRRIARLRESATRRERRFGGQTPIVARCSFFPWAY